MFVSVRTYTFLSAQSKEVEKKRVDKELAKIRKEFRVRTSPLLLALW